MSTQSKRRLSLGALALALCAAGPVAAQATLQNETHTVTVQNNHHRPLTVYLQSAEDRLDLTLGTVGGMQTATLTIPNWAVRDESQVEVVVQPRGGVPLEGEALVSERGPHFGIMVGHTGRVMKNEGKMWTAAPFDMNTTTVTVRNQGKHATTVFLQGAFRDRRLGEVPAFSEMTFEVPKGFVDQPGEVVLMSNEGRAESSSTLQLEQGKHFGISVD